MHKNTGIIVRSLLRDLSVGGVKGGLAIDVGGRDVNGSNAEALRDFGWNRKVLDREAAHGVDYVGELPADALDLETWRLLAAFDLALCTNVLEHVKDPHRFVWAASLMVKPGGWMIFVTPNNIHRHRHPLDCWRIFDDGMRALLERFEEVRVGETALAEERVCDTWGIARIPR